MKHVVRLCRPRFEVALLDVEAKDYEAAGDAAAVLALGVPPDSWHLQAYDAEQYRPHIERCISQDDIDAIVDDEPEDKEDDYVSRLRDLDDTGDIRYLLLFADIGIGEGRVIFQPWFHLEDPELLESDLSNDWTSELEEIEEEALENYEALASGIKDPLPELDPATVIPFRVLREGNGSSQSPADDLPDPRQYKTAIPALLARPLKREEHNAVMACLSAIDKILAEPQTVMMRTELAAALLAHACSAAFESAAAQGEPQQGQMRYDMFEKLAVERSRELYAQDRA